MTSLSALIEKLVSSEEEVTNQINIDELVGDIRNKVDSIKYVMDKLDFTEKWLASQIEPLQKAKQSVARNRESLKKYVETSMASQNIEALPGETWRMKLQDNASFAAEVTQPANAELFTKFPEYVAVKREYYFKLDKIKEDFIANKLEEKNFGCVKFSKGKHLRIYLNKDKALKGGDK